MTESYDTIIVGGGLSGLTAAQKLTFKNPDHNLLILEKRSRTGGCIQSHHQQRYIAEIGPHGFLDNCQESKELLAETGLDNESVKAPLLKFVRYVYLHGKLNLIEQTPFKLLKAPLIPWKDKFRVLKELVRPPLRGEPTVAKWVDYRFGPALLPYLDAALTGTYAGDFNRLKIDAVMPGVRKIEKEHGSVIRGLLTNMWRAKKSGSKQKLAMPAMTSFPGGMQRLTDKLAEPFLDAGKIRTETTVTKISKLDGEWQVETEDGQFFQSKNLVVALPINASLALLRDIDPDMPLQSVPEPKIATVVFGFDNGATLPPGFGFLTPEVEKRFTLGTLFSSNMFPGRAPEGHIVFETLIGGRRHPERLELSDAELIASAQAEVKEILNLPGEPAYTKVLRSAWGIPQLEENYPKLLDWKEQLETREAGLFVCGFGWGGIGINDMIKNSTKVAKGILEGRSERPDVEMEKVYF